jgi:Uma2 family endonuclease
MNSMIAAQTRPKVSPDDLLRMEDDGLAYELVNGKLVVKPTGGEESGIASELAFHLHAECKRHQPPLGWVTAGAVPQWNDPRA